MNTISMNKQISKDFGGGCWSYSILIQSARSASRPFGRKTVRWSSQIAKNAVNLTKGEKIRMIRGDLGFNQADLANVVGVSGFSRSLVIGRVMCLTFLPGWLLS